MKRILLLLVLFVQCGMAMAQELNIKSFEPLPRDLYARTHERLDLNEVPCAVVRVSVANPESYTFSGNIVGDVIYGPGEVILYMASRSRNLTIKSSKFGSLKFDFPERLEKQVVYKLTMKLELSEDQKIRTLVMPVMGVGSHLSYGVMVGLVKKYGAYLKVKSDFKANSTDFVCNDEGLLQDGTGEGTELWFTEKTRASRLAITAGGMMRVARPLYAYCGLGWGYKKLAWETVDGMWAENGDHTYKGLEVDAGLVYRHKNYALNAGVQTNQGKYWEATVGVGIMF